jgi:hypothetical protein
MNFEFLTFSLYSRYSNSPPLARLALLGGKIQNTVFKLFSLYQILAFFAIFTSPGGPFGPAR